MNAPALAEQEIRRMSEPVMPNVSPIAVMNHIREAKFDRDDMLGIGEEICARIVKLDDDCDEALRLQRAFYEYERYCARDDERRARADYNVNGSV